MNCALQCSMLNTQHARLLTMQVPDFVVHGAESISALLAGSSCTCRQLASAHGQVAAAARAKLVQTGAQF